jgi:hypothetical protein
MLSFRNRLRLSLLSLAAVLALAPAAFSAEHGVSASTAVCNTCCNETESVCVVGNLRTLNSYDNGPNKCPTVVAPPTGG